MWILTRFIAHAVRVRSETVSSRGECAFNGPFHKALSLKIHQGTMIQTENGYYECTDTIEPSLKIFQIQTHIYHQQRVFIYRH